MFVYACVVLCVCVYAYFNVLCVLFVSVVACVLNWLFVYVCDWFNVMWLLCVCLTT